MSVIIGALGLSAAQEIRAAAELAGRIHEQSLASAGSAQAAATDFAEMKAGFARRMATTSDVERRTLDRDVAALELDLMGHLTVAGDRSPSPRAIEAAAATRQAVLAWDEARAGTDAGPVDWVAVDAAAGLVGRQIDRLMQGLRRRQGPRPADDEKTLATDIRATMLCTGLALLLSAFVVSLLARRIIGPVALASQSRGRSHRAISTASSPEGRRRRTRRVAPCHGPDAQQPA